jgi:hypothetical protein
VCRDDRPRPPPARRQRAIDSGLEYERTGGCPATGSAPIGGAVIDSGVINATHDVAIGWLRDGRRFVEALLFDVEGSAPLPVGAVLVVDEHGHIEGSITGGCVEGAVVEEAEAILAAGHGAKVLT